MILAYDSMNIIDVRMKRIKSVSQGVKKTKYIIKNKQQERKSYFV